jgi:oxygen-dependent protoporphyrinogen oxidase
VSEHGTSHVVVVGGGISGLAAVERLLRARPDARVTLLDAAPRLGGVIETERVHGPGGDFVLERGPDVVLAAKPATRELCERLGIADRLCGTAARGAYVWRAGALHRVPQGLTGLVPSRLAPIATTPLLSWRGKLRLAAEWVLPPGRHDGDESVAEFVTRRFGAEAYAHLVEPLLGGIYAGDARRLGVLATFPQLRALERERGGLLRGVARGGRGGARQPAASGPAFLTLPGGLGELVDVLARALARDPRVTVRQRTPARAVLAAPGRGGVRVALADGAVLWADAAVLATPAHEAARLLAGIDPALARELGAIEHASTATVTLALPRSAVPRALDATGYVVPRAAGRRALACTWVSSKFAGRAPADAALFRVFFGGAGREREIDVDDDALVAAARDELRETLGAAGAPLLARVARWDHAMPQYAVGHRERVARIEGTVARHPALALAGNAYHGVGIPDCIRSGERAAERVVTALGAPEALAAAG